MQQWPVPHFSRQLLTTSWVFFFFFVCQLVVIGSFASSPSPAPPCTLILPLPLIQPRQIFWCLPVSQISGNVRWDSWLFFFFWLSSLFFCFCFPQYLPGSNHNWPRPSFFFFRFYLNVFQTSKSSSKQVQVDTAPQTNKENRSKTKCFQWPKVSSSPVLLVSCSSLIPSFLYLFCCCFVHSFIYIFIYLHPPPPHKYTLAPTPQSAAVAPALFSREHHNRMWLRMI